MRVSRASIAVLVACIVLAPARAQKKKADVCPWCRNDPALMKAAGVVGHGPMPIGAKTSTELAADLPAGQWIFLETTHLRWASSLPAVVVELADKERVESELARLRLALPDVPKEPKKLDPWLRLHLIAMKGEELYTRFEKLLAVTDADFPESRGSGPFMGDGRFLGEKDKFEVVLHARHATHELFTKDFSGASVTNAVRWHFPSHKLLVSIPCEDPDYKQDRWLFPHVAHDLSHLFFCAYKHFSYDPPAWLDEGLALCMEREIEPRSSTNEGEEGSFRDDKGPKDPTKAVLELVQRGKQKSVAELMHVKEPGALDRDALLTSWSIVRFLIDTRPADVAKLLGGVKGQLDERGLPTGRDLPGLQRKLFKDVLGWTPQELDEAWRAWVARPPEPPPK